MKLIIKPIVTVVLLALTITGLTNIPSNAQNNTIPNFVEAYAGHNDMNANRINLGFYFESRINMAERKRLVENMLRFNGPVYEEIPGGKQNRIGLFQLYPFSEHKNKFNILISTQNNDQLPSLVNNNPMKDFYTADIYYTGDINKSILETHSYALLDGNYLRVENSDYELPSTFAHELSHALLNLDDEYPNSNAQKDSSQCVNTRERANQLWGSLVGKVSKSFLQFKEYTKNDLNIEPSSGEYYNPKDIITAESAKVGFVERKCYKDNTTAFVASQTSLMNDRSFFFNSYQESIAEKVLNSFTGKSAAVVETPKPVTPTPTTPNNPAIIAPKPDTTVNKPTTTPTTTPSTNNTIKDKIDTTVNNPTVRTGAPYAIGIAGTFILAFFILSIIVLKKIRKAN
jgi:hypothetical protein